MSQAGSSWQEATQRYGSAALTIADICVLYLLIAPADLECMPGRGDAPGDKLGALVPSASAGIVLQLEGLGTPFSQRQTGIYYNGVLNRVDA